MASSIIDEFIQALDEEITAIKKGKGGGIVKVFNGRFLREVSGFFVYVFNLENFLTVLGDSPADIQIRGSQYPAQVLLTQGLEAEIGIEHYCGEFIPEATLQTNLWYLLELLKKKFSEYQSGAAKIDFGLSEALFSSLQSDSKPVTQTKINYSLGKKPPNEAQKHAIEESFYSPLCIIWGPPGTGKTYTVSKAIEAHLNAGRRVLLVSHANNAVDEALEDVAHNLKITPFYQEGKLVRLGKPQEEHLKKLEKDYELVLLDKIADKRGESLIKERNALEQEKTQIEDTLNKFASARNALETYRTLSSELNSLRSSVLECERLLSKVQHELNSLEESQAKNKTRLMEAQSAGWLRRFFIGLNPQKIQLEIDHTTISLDSKKRSVDEIATRLNEIKVHSKAKEDEAKTAKREADNLLKHLAVSEEEFDSKRKESDQRKDIILARISEINRQLDEIQKNILSEARLVATTLTKTFVAKQLPDEPFDVIVLDEASMAPLPHLYWAVGHCREFITIVGDFLQLPPICISEKDIAKKWLKRSIFDILDIKSIRKAASNTRVKLLDTQHRMAPAISEVSNRFFYDGMLKNHPSTLNLGLDDGVSEAPLVLVETATMNPWCSRIFPHGRFNLYNALICTTLAKHIIQHTPDCRIGIIAPYRHQARLINKIAKDWRLLDRVRISTIHMFQGGEEPIIILDTTEGTGTKIAPMLDDTNRDSDARLVLNVALTRAESRLYLVAHTKHLLAGLHRESSLSQIINYFHREADTLESESLVDNYFTTDFEKWADALLATPSSAPEPVSGELYTERNFWAQFLSDIKTVKKRLIILSPFLSVRRCGMLMDYFRAMAKQEIKIRIYTRPKSQQVSEMANQAEVLIKQLRSINASVIELSKMHQKVAILDNAIAWEGSLNILSHRDTGEHMRRFEGASAIEEIIRNLGLEEDYPPGTITEEKCPGKNGMVCKYNGYLVVRGNRKRGTKFWGCSRYPACKYTRPLSERIAD